MSTTTANPTTTVRNAGDLAAVVRAREERAPLVDYGIAHAGLGHAPPVVHTRLLQQADPANNGILEHYTRDLTVRAAAGISIGDLQRALKPTNQFAPIDADDDITLGEAIHHNTYGPLRVGYGSIRDLLLGLHYIDGEGRDVHVGGRTVKNVAGYDLSRFMVGSLGELGIVHEATMRTYAIPERVLEAELVISQPSLFDERGTELLLSDAKPTHLSFSLGADRSIWTAHVAYFGKPSGCAVQMRALEAFIGQGNSTQVTKTTERGLEDDAAARAQRRAWRRKAAAVVKIIVPPASTGAICSALAAWSAAGEPLHIDALPMHGCIFVGGDLSAYSAGELDEAVRTAIEPVSGLRVWHARPAGAESIDPFGAPQSDWPVLMKLKRTMDPHSIFNHGRFLREGMA